MKQFDKFIENVHNFLLALQSCFLLLLVLH